MFIRLLSILIVPILSTPSFGEKMDDLFEKDGLYYRKFADVPFTGAVEGNEKGSLKDGKREGLWVWYYNNEHLFGKGEYKDGKEEGPFAWYYENGQLFLKGEYEDGKRGGLWVKYYDNGQLEYKRQYKDGKRNGHCISYYEDGSVNQDDTGTYKNGERVSN